MSKVVQEEIARAVVAALKLKLLPAAAVPRAVINQDAHDQYLLGRAFLARGSGDSSGRAVEALSRAVQLDPEYAPASAQLAFALFWYGDSAANGVAAVEWPKATAAAEKAIALAPDLAEGYVARAMLRATYGDREGQHQDLSRARALSPGGVDSLVQYGTMHAEEGRLPEAVAALERATALDPLWSDGWTRLGICYLGQRRLDLAEGAAKRALDISPEHARAARTLGVAMLLGNRLEEARAAFRRCTNPIFARMGEAMVEHALGHPAKSQRELDLILADPRGSEYQVAQIYAWRGETDRAFEWLSLAVKNHDGGLWMLKTDPILRSLRGDPRYAALLQTLKLPQ